MNTYCFFFKTIIRGEHGRFAVVVAESEHEARDMLSDFLVDIENPVGMDDIERVEVLREGDIRLS